VCVGDAPSLGICLSARSTERRHPSSSAAQLHGKQAQHGLGEWNRVGSCSRPQRGTSIATGSRSPYQVVGDGPVDVLLAPGNVSHLDLAWADPGVAGFLAPLASFSRLIIYDKPSTGLSDPIDHVATLEERAADIEAILDAAGSQRKVLFGVSEGGPASVLMAATSPHRIISLILWREEPSALAAHAGICAGGGPEPKGEGLVPTATGRRRAAHEHTSFTVLGYAFRSRGARGKYGGSFHRVLACD
jgi:pimeloyl-ACP methyl ester carboxylesterase